MNTTAWFAIFANVALKSTLVLGIAGLLSVVLRQRSAAMRHLLWTAALVAVLVLPLLSVSLPALRLPMTASLPHGISALFQAVVTADSEPVAAGSISISPRTARPLDWRLGIILVWISGIAVSVARLIVSTLALRRLERSAPISAHQGLAHDLASALSIRRPVTVLEMSEGTMPMASGVWRGAVLMPRDSAQWPEERCRMVLLHELAHVRRGDVCTHLLARLGLALHWWNPLAWFAWREFLKERERAADDLVLQCGARGSDYAGHLLAVARGMHRQAALGSAAIAMARRSNLEGRVIAILDSRVDRAAAGRATVFAAALVALALVVPFAAVRAQDQTGKGVARNGSQVSAVQAGPAAALVHQGVLALRDKNYGQAIEYFQQARNRDPKEAARAQMWLAVTYEHDSNPTQAEAFYRSALGAATPDSGEPAVIMELYARFLKEQRRDQDAQPLFDRARQLRESEPPNSTAVRIGPGIMPPKVLYKVEPAYSDEARAAQYQGTVVLFVEIGPEGLAHNIQVVRALGLGLTESAINAVSQWQFSPAERDGEPVTVQATIEVNFRLQ